MVSKNRLEELFTYSKDTGVFLSKRTMKKIGSKRPDGYIQIGVDHKMYLAHRLAWILIHGEIINGYCIDHINRKKEDNRIHNLRCVSYSENMQNLGRNQKNTTGVTGVSWSKSNKKWQAQIGLWGKNKHLGFFDDFKDAVNCRQLAEENYGFSINHGYPI